MEVLTFAATAALSLLPMVDPFGNMPIFAALTDELPKQAVRRVAIKANLVALIGILFFGFAGRSVFGVFGITLDGLRIVGGVIFFVMGYDMLQARLARTKVSDPMTDADKSNIDDVAITPLGIPLVCGPGAMTSAMLLMAKADGPLLKVGFVLGTLAVLGFGTFCFIGANQIARVIGTSGTRVILRLMGLLLMVMAVESFFAGLTPIMRSMSACP